MGSGWLLHELCALTDGEHASGATTTGVTQFLGFPERDKQGRIGLGVELCGDIDDLVLSITKHLNSPKESEVSTWITFGCVGEDVTIHV